MKISQSEKPSVFLICESDTLAADIENRLRHDFEIHKISSDTKPQEETGNPDLIIAISHDEQKCYEICKHAGSLKKDEYVPILLITSDNIDEEMTSYIDDFIIAPVDTLELETRINSLMRIKKLHDTLLRERDQAQTYIDVANCVVGVVDTNLNIILANKGASEVLGYPQEEIIGQNWFDIFLPERVRDFIKAGYIQVLEGKLEPPEFSEKPILTKSGEERLVFWHDVVLRDDNNQIIGTISSGEDITERKQVEEALTQANQEYYVLDKMKNDFMVNLSRELRTPIISIKGFCKLLNSDEIGILTPSQKKAVETVSRNAERLHHLIDSLLYTSEELIEQVHFDFCSVNLQENLDDIIKEMEPLASKKKITIEKQIKELPTMWGDEAHLKRVFFHLLDNAIKFTPESGIIQVLALPKDNSIEVAIKDTGIGIPPEKINDIFRSFYQIDGSTTRKYDGTGVGLYICKKVVEQHMGTISVASQVGVGSTFTISLPTKNPEMVPENFAKLPVGSCGYNN
ncbi:PAS domain S-box-containing protein [Methanohalophilus levihalophilus]|uniref:ATP-binding protein n=1 Tax=Methanohalophilus levihalophilus TaxID=1431282 RepID=UPI001AE5E691|nr:ATP-binding protein [Methanohalophilus levihalophilus]MBP2029124.1 PAS domain S-box-containing protein [Methanohalophilus levihalophilus]